MEVLRSEITDLQENIESIFLRNESIYGVSVRRIKETQRNDTDVVLIQNRVECFLRRRRNEDVKSVFEIHADPKTKLISSSKLQNALKEFGILLNVTEAEKLMIAMDTDCNGGLDLQEFTTALNQPPTQVEQFVDTLPLTGMLAACLSEPGSEDPLKALCNIAPDSSDLTSRIDAFTLSLRKLLQSELVKLREMVDAMEAEKDEWAGNAGSKFAAGMVGMNAGTTDEFHRGIQERLGEHRRQARRARAPLQRPSTFFSDLQR